MANISRRAFLRHVAAGTGTVVFFASGLTAKAAQDAYQLRILHTNDHHARIEPVTGGTPVAPIHAGVSRRKKLIDAARAQGGNLLVLDAGDVFQGTLYFNQYKGMADLEFYNAMGYDAMAIGNHEFDIGQAPLATFIRGASFPVLSANLRTDGSSPINGLFKPWVIKEVNGEKIGIFGLTTEETGVLSNPGPGVSFTNYLDAARQSVSELRAQGATKIVALTHIGIDADRMLAKSVDGIGIVIGGHSHTPMGPMVSPANANRPYPEVHASPSGKPVVVATDWEWGRWLGDLTIGFAADGSVLTVVAGNPMEVKASLEPDQGFEARIADFRGPIQTLLTTKVGSSAVALNGARTDVRSKETNLSNLIADATLAKTKATGVQIAIVNGGGVRASIPAGDVTIGQVLEVLPFGNTVTVLTVTGAQLKEALENGVSQVESGAGRFPQVGGMRYTYNPAAPVNSRVLSMELKTANGYTAVDPAGSYRVAVNSFVAAGGDGYSVFAKATDITFPGFLDSDVLIEYLQQNSPVNPQVEGRITVGTAAAAPAPAPAPAPGTGAAPAPAPAPAPADMPASLPNTSGDLSPMWMLAALGASAIGSGVALRNRGLKQAQDVETEEETVA